MAMMILERRMEHHLPAMIEYRPLRPKRQPNLLEDVELVHLDGRHPRRQSTTDPRPRRIGAGDATALLVIPAGFQNAVVGSGSAQLQLVTNPAQRVLPALVQQMLDVLVEAAFYGQRLFGEPLRRVAGPTGTGPPSDANVAAIAVAVNQEIAKLQGVLLPPIISLSVKSEASPWLTSRNTIGSP